MAQSDYRIKAVFFDLDGVIVDSMPYHFIAWNESLRPFGLRLSCFEVYRREGEFWGKTIRELLRKAGIKPSQRLLEKVFKKRSRIFKRIFKRYIFPEAENLLKELREKGVILGLVTGTPRRELDRILPKRVLKFFKVIVPGDEVVKGKPDPEPYLKASALTGISPRDCLVVENAPLGIKSANRAGIRCIAITTSLPARYLDNADITVTDFPQIQKAINKLSKLP